MFYIKLESGIICFMKSYMLILFLGFVLSLVVVLVLMPFYIKLLHRLKYNQSVSEYALDEYKNKAATPIMGGLLFVIIPVLVTLVIDTKIVNDPLSVMVILSYLLFCLVGFLDDILIIINKDNKGLSPKLKMLMQIVFAALIYFAYRNYLITSIHLPLINIDIPLGFVYSIFMVFVYCAESNAVNFTDGMDGLCSGVSLISLIPFLVFAINGNKYDLAILIVSIMGALIGYLRYNFYPASIFMGDSGSLALGALFASIAIALNKEIALIFVGGVFVYEMLCVCIQQIAVRVFKRRVFRYTPIHYAFVLRGMIEKKVVIMFYGMAAIFSLIGFVIGVI